MARVLVPARNMPDVQARGTAAAAAAAREAGVGTGLSCHVGCRSAIAWHVHRMRHSTLHPWAWLLAVPPLRHWPGGASFTTLPPAAASLLPQADVPAEVRQGLQVVACHRLEDVLAAAFDPPIQLAPQPLLARL